MNKKIIMVACIMAMLTAMPAFGESAGSTSSATASDLFSTANTNSWAETLNTRINVNSQSTSFIGSASAGSGATAGYIPWLGEASYGSASSSATGILASSSSDAYSRSNNLATTRSTSDGSGLLGASSYGGSWSSMGYPNEASSNAGTDVVIGYTDSYSEAIAID